MKRNLFALFLFFLGFTVFCNAQDDLMKMAQQGAKADKDFTIATFKDTRLVNQQTLLYYTRELNGQLFEPIKTTNVQNLRCMTTWCLEKM